MVGLGLAAASHVHGYQGCPGCELIAVCDLDEQRARRFAAQHSVPLVYTSFREMLANDDILAVGITTPTFLHAPMALQALEAGKHVHCEKPFCVSVPEGLEVCEAARRSGATLAVGETYVFLSSHMKARELIEAGEIGRPVQIRERHGGWIERKQPRIDTGPADRTWRVNPVQSGGGEHPWIFDHAVHFFAAAEDLMLGQPIVEVYAVGGGRPGRTRAGATHDPYTSAEAGIPIITWKHRDESCHGVWMRAERLNGIYDYMRGFSTTILGESGVVEVLGEGGGNLFWDGRPQHLILHRDGKETCCFRFEEGGDAVWDSEISYYSQAHIRQVRHFVDCILRNEKPRYGGEDGVRAVQATLAAIRSAREQRPIRVD
ncbi:MAG: Gfo/Idh/MocA family oxidoreductase [Acidobacteria bacterium]|nr:Gfo/Idh/MocA family oxidoreductase [Acidobacteriota bacterium]